MTEDKIAELALKCFDGDHEKAIALLELLKISIEPTCKMPDVEMQLDDPSCRWEKCGDCWKDIPDSIRRCKKPCAFYKPCTN